MKKHKTKILVAAVIVAVLAGAWFLGGTGNIETPYIAADAENAIGDDYALYGETNPEADESAESPTTEANDYEDETSNSYGHEESATPSDEDEAEPQQEADETEPSPEPETDEPLTPHPPQEDTPNNTPEPYNPEAQETQQDPHPTEETAETDYTNNTNETPPEPDPTTSNSFTVTLTIRVDTLLHNMHLLDSDKHELVPPDGIIFPTTQVTAYEGESVFNVLQREMRRVRIHMASRFTPGYNSAYVEAINNIYAYDAGPLSGWMYSVNGVFPNFGSSLYILNPGDVIEWIYSLDLGRDLGEDWQR